MHELGHVQYAAHGAHALKPPRNEASGPIEETAKITVSHDDAAVAVIRNPWGSEDVKQDGRHGDAGRPGETGQKTNAIAATAESSRYHVYSKPGKFSVKIANEIEAINSYDGFLLGVHDKIEKFSKQTEFELKEVLDVEQRMGKLYETLELYRFTLKRIKSEALKSLRCQGNLGPQRALHLLEETIEKQIAAEQHSDTALPVEQTEQNTR